MKYQVSQRMKEQFVGLDQRKDSQPSRKFPHLKITYSWRALKVLSVLTKEDEIIPRFPSFRTQVRWCTLLLCLNSHCMSSSLCILQGLSHTSIEGKAQECLQLDERQQDLWTAAFSTQPTIPRILNSLTDKSLLTAHQCDWEASHLHPAHLVTYTHSTRHSDNQLSDIYLYYYFFPLPLHPHIPLHGTGRHDEICLQWERYERNSMLSRQDDKGLRSQVSLAGMLEATQNSTPSTT